MKVVFFGLGSIGQKYHRILSENFDCDIFAYRTRNLGGVLPIKQNLWDWDSVYKVKPDVAFITNPTFLHIETAIKCAERGMHLFITKPIDCKIDYSLQHLKNIVAGKELTAFIAYPLRHLPVIQKLKQEKYDCSTWQFVCRSDLAKWRNYKTYSAKYAEGGGALLELSHELDLATYLLGPVMKIKGHTFSLRDDTDAEDVAELVLYHRNSHVNVSYHSLSLASDVEERYFYYDGKRYDIVVDDSVYLEQLRYFFDHIGKPIMNSIFEASKLFKLLMEFRNETTNNNMRQGR